MVKPTHVGGDRSTFTKRESSHLARAFASFIAATRTPIYEPNSVHYWLSGLVCVCILLNTAITGFGNFGRGPNAPRQPTRLIPAWFRDEVPTVEPKSTVDTAASTPVPDTISTPAPDTIHNVAPTTAIENTPDGNVVGTSPPPVKTEPAPDTPPPPVPTETPRPPDPSATAVIPTSTDTPPTVVVPSNTPAPHLTDTPAPIVTKEPPPTEVTPVPTVPTAEPTKVTPSPEPTIPTAVPTVPTATPKPAEVFPTTAVTEEPKPTAVPSATDVPVVVVTKLPTRPPLGTPVKPPSAAVPVISPTPFEDTVPEVPKEKGQPTPSVGEGKPTSAPVNGGTVLPPTNPNIGLTATQIAVPIATAKPQDQVRPQENVFMPALPAIDPTSVIPASPTPKSLEEFVQTTAPKNAVAAPQFAGPILVYTYTQKMLAEGLYVVAACVANVGDQPDSSVTLSFNSVAPVAIQHLLSASEFGEIDQNQRGFVNIASLPPDRQKQFEIVVTAPEMPLPELMTINLSRGYKLNRPEEAKIKCEPQGTLSKLPEFAPVEITISGQEAPPGTIAELAKQLQNPTKKALDAQIKQRPSSWIWEIPYDNTYLVFVGVIAAMAGVFGLMTIGRRIRP